MSASRAEARAICWCWWCVCPSPSILPELHLGKKRKTSVGSPCPPARRLCKRGGGPGVDVPFPSEETSASAGWWGSRSLHVPRGGEDLCVCVCGGQPPLGLFCGSPSLIEVKPNATRAVGMASSIVALALQSNTCTGYILLVSSVQSEVHLDLSFNRYFWFHSYVI